MSRNDDEQSRYRTPEDRIRERNLRDPYEAQRPVRTYGSEDDYDADHPWQAAHPGRDAGGARGPRRSEQPARYGGNYRDDELWSRPRDARGDARYGLDTEAERHYVEGYRNEDDRHRAHGYGRSYDAWRDERNVRGDHAQSNSGYDGTRAYGQGNRQDDARADARRASWTQEHDYDGPRYGASRDTPRGRGDIGGQYAHTDTYGGAGFRQQGKRYWFDEGDERSQFRGTQPRGYERSDDRLRELACERLTDADLDASDIEVKVSQGIVTLEGSVRARWMKHAAEDIVDDLGGVKDIQNHLRVNRPGAGDTQAASTGTGTPSPSTGATGAAAPGATPSGTGGEMGGRSRH